MAQLQLKQDEFRLLVVIPDDESIGNTAARTVLGWSKLRYQRARQGLLDKQLVVKARGRGGALRRAPVVEHGIDVDTANDVVRIRPPQPESALYKPILKTLRGEWSEDRGFEALVIEQLAHQGRRDTGGQWTRPDLVAVGSKTFRHVPHQQFEIITFEVKAMGQLNVVAVFEALAHRRAATHSYVLVEVRAELASASKAALDAVVNAAQDHGIGVITFDSGDDFETWEEVVPAVRCDASPEALNDFIETQVSREGQKTIEVAIARSRTFTT